MEPLLWVETAKANGIFIINIGNRCKIKNAIIDKNCHVGNDVCINCGDRIPDGDYNTYTVQDGIVVVKKRAVIPNGTVI